MYCYKAVFRVTRGKRGNGGKQSQHNYAAIVHHTHMLLVYTYPRTLQCVNVCVYTSAHLANVIDSVLYINYIL